MCGATGSLIRLIAFASLTGQEITQGLAQDVLRNVIDHEEKAITIEIIQKFISDYYNLRLADLKSRNNSKSVARPRQVAMYPMQVPHARVAAGNRPKLAAKHLDCHPLDPEGRGPPSQGWRFQHPYEQLLGGIPLAHAS